MDHKDRATACLIALDERIEALHELSTTVLDALMVLYMDIDKHKDAYEYGRMDASAAWQATYRFMQFQDELARIETGLQGARYSVQAISNGLYGPHDD